MSTPPSKTISSNSALPTPWSTAPSSWRSTSSGLIALPTSAIVAIRSTLTRPVSGSTPTSAAAMQISQNTGPSA